MLQNRCKKIVGFFKKKKIIFDGICTLYMTGWDEPIKNYLFFIYNIQYNKVQS